MFKGVWGGYPQQVKFEFGRPDALLATIYLLLCEGVILTHNLILDIKIDVIMTP